MTKQSYVYSPKDIGILGNEYLTDRKEQVKSGLTIPIYIASLDENFLPLLPGELITIIGRPGCGKTALLMRWARFRANHLNGLSAKGVESASRRVVVYVTYEQSIEELHSFHVAAETGVSITTMARGTIPDDKWELVNAAAYKRAQLPLWFIGHSAKRRIRRPRLDLDTLAESLYEFQEWNEGFIVDSIFLDYVQRMPTDRGVESKTVAVSNNLDGLKDLAIEMAVPIIAGVQARREVDQQNPQIPGLDDGQWTSNIEQSSDKVLSVVRPAHYRHEGESFGDVIVKGENQMAITVLKQKLGKDNFLRWVDFDVAYNKLNEAELVHYDLNEQYWNK
jgi:replicative DNA helicase